jgi:hypothetical protein
MTSESLIVEIRCAITSVVLFFIMRSSDSCTIFSFSESRADVASSRSRICGSFAIARAIAILCFCPPEICVPFEPTFLSNPEALFLLASIFIAICPGCRLFSSAFLRFSSCSINPSALAYSAYLLIYSKVIESWL